MKLVACALTLWWFMSISSSYGIVLRQGPFPTEKECELKKAWVAAYGIVTSNCWQSPTR